MEIDWTTFVLEIVNFLALVWLLKRFLYQPVLGVLSERRAGIEHRLAEARETEARAADLKAQFENRLAEWQQEKAALRAGLESELAAERARQTQSMNQTLALERERQVAQETHRQAERQHELEAQAMAVARNFATRLLSRLAGPELETRLVEVFIDDFAGLPEEQLAGLRTAALSPNTQVEVTSAFPLGEDQRRRIAEIIAARLGRPLELACTEDSQLLAGLRIAVGPWQLGLCLTDELAAFAAAANHAG